MKHLFIAILLTFTIGTSIAVEIFKSNPNREGIQEIDVSADDEFGIQLEYHAGTGYEWIIEQPSPKLIQTLSSSFDRDEDDDRDGKPLVKQFNFIPKSFQAGKRTYLRFGLKRSWENESEATVEFIVNIN